jgi:hypothetical protein
MYVIVSKYELTPTFRMAAEKQKLAEVNFRSK